MSSNLRETLCCQARLYSKGRHNGLRAGTTAAFPSVSDDECVGPGDLHPTKRLPFWEGSILWTSDASDAVRV